jgi:ribosomal-protein-alanine N-acetyltransferase
MFIETRRFLLRDFAAPDRAAFVAYQLDPRYRRLYDIQDGADQNAVALFELFMSWQTQNPRLNIQLGVFVRDTAQLCGCAGLRCAGQEAGTAELGIELSPDYWGRHRFALEIASALLRYGFEVLKLQRIVGSTASGNARVERLARWFGANILEQRSGAAWMSARGWQEVDWALTRETWRARFTTD